MRCLRRRANHESVRFLGRRPQARWWIQGRGVLSDVDIILQLPGFGSDKGVAAADPGLRDSHEKIIESISASAISASLRADEFPRLDEICDDDNDGGLENAQNGE